MVARPGERSRAALPRCARILPGLRLCPRAARAGRGSEGPPHDGNRLRAPRRRDASTPPVGRHAGRPLGAGGEPTRGRGAVRARRSDPSAARGERCPHRPRDSALRRRPRGAATPRAHTRAPRLPCTAEHRRLRRPRVGARPQRALLGGAPLLPPGAAARDARCAQVLPPGDDRALPPPRDGCAGLVRQGAAPEPALLDPLEPGRAKVRMKRAALLFALLGALTAPAAASAHPLGNFTVNRFSGIELSGGRAYVKYVLD